MRVAHALVVSDLHLAPERPAIVERFRRFAAAEARAAAALYVLGDFFEYWIGDDDAADALNGALLADLSALARSGVDVAFMHGNRDFLFSSGPAVRAGIRLLEDAVLLDLFGTPTLLMHGDTLCTDDVAYQSYRAAARHPVTKLAFGALPRRLRVAVGRGMRRTSESQKQAKSAMIMDVNAETVAQTLRHYGYPRLIHGHTHRPGRYEHTVDGRPCERWVLPDWYKRGGYLRCDAHGCELVMLD